MKENTATPFEGIIGYESIKKELSLLLDELQHEEKYANLGIKRPHAVLLEGQPGVGKTLFAEAFLKASGYHPFILRKGQADGSFVSTIQTTFDQAIEQAPSIILLDDMDKYADTEGRKDSNADEYIVVQTKIDEIQDKKVFVLATLNNKDVLPESLLRPGRFGQILHLDPPEGKEAEAIIAYYLSQIKNLAPVDPVLISRMLDGKSCATLAAVVNEAAALAVFHQEKTISREDLVNAILKLVYGALENSKERNLLYLKETAYHEAGHTLMQELLEPGSVTFVSIKKFSADSEGYTFFKTHDDYFQDLRYMRNRIQMLLAGKAAVEIMCGKVDVGMSLDVSRAREIASRFPLDYCAYGFGFTEIRSDPSDFLRAREEARLSAELENAYLTTRETLFQHRDKLEALTEALLKKETLFPEDIASIVRS